MARRVSLVIDGGRQKAGMRVREVMVTDATVISRETMIDAAAQIMADLNLARVRAERSSTGGQG